jgi:hypothetical protein
MFYIPCIIDNRFTTINQQNAQTCFLDIYITISHLTSLHVSVHKGPSSGNQTKVIQHERKLVTRVYSLRGAKASNS